MGLFDFVKKLKSKNANKDQLFSVMCNKDDNFIAASDIINRENAYIRLLTRAFPYI